MSLRKQCGGFQKPWTLAELKEGLEKFYLEYGKYPTSEQVDNFPYLPSSRSIQRSHGGLIALREELALSPLHDFTRGEYSSKRARDINKRGHKYEAIVFDFLKNKFGVQFVHREFFVTDDSRSRIDFYIYYKGGVFAIDVFYPSTRHSLVGCLNAKMHTYTTESMKDVQIIFLQMNTDIDSETLQKIAKNKKNKLSKNQHLMTFTDLERFCNNKEPLQVHR
jgi:hypothetical protein